MAAYIKETGKQGEQNSSYKNDLPSFEEKNKSQKYSQQREVIMQILKQPVQMIFCFVAILSLFGCIPFTYYCYQFTQKAKADAPQGYEFPHGSDFWVTFVAAIGFLLTDYTFYKIFVPLFRPICKIQDDIDVREQRVEKMANSLFRLLYFSGITIYGYIAVMDMNFFPSALGGSGDYNLCTLGFPYQKHNQRTQ